MKNAVVSIAMLIDTTANKQIYFNEILHIFQQNSILIRQRGCHERFSSSHFQYKALPEKYTPTQINPASAYGAQASAKMDFKYADATSEGQLNEILWHDIKGANTPYPGSKGSTTTTASDTDG